MSFLFFSFFKKIHNCVLIIITFLPSFLTSFQRCYRNKFLEKLFTARNETKRDISTLYGHAGNTIKDYGTKGYRVVPEEIKPSYKM